MAAPGAISRLKAWARALKNDVWALSLAARDRRVGIGAKLLAGAVTAYALSPIDLIPDFVPVLGLLDDVVIVPAGIWLVVRLIGPELMREFRERAASRSDRPSSRIGLVLILSLWCAGAYVASLFLRRT